MTTKVVCVTGMPGSGKEEFINVAIELGFEVVRMGDLVREAACERELDLNDTSVGGLANDERKKHGMGIWAERTTPRITGSRTVIDGIRGIAEIEVFRKAFSPNLFVVSIKASSETRYERIRLRGRRDATLTMEQFKERDERERGWGIEQAMDEADHIILNEGPIEEYREEVRRVLAEITEL